MDSTYEHSEVNSGREHLDGIGIQLIEDTSEDQLSKAEEEIASALSLPELPSVNEQKREIENRVAALYAGEIAIPSEVVDEVLRTGGNRSKSQLRITSKFYISFSIIRINTIHSSILRYRKTLILPRIYHD